MSRLLLAVAVAATAFATPSATADECKRYSCCVRGTDVCWGIDPCVCPYDGCWCLPGGSR